MSFSKYVINGEFDIHIQNSIFTPKHKHLFLELAYVLNGQAEHFLNNKKTIISKGDYLILDYDAAHSYKSIGNKKFEVINCLFLPQFIDKTLSKCKNFSEVVNNYMLKYNCSITNLSPANYIFHDDDNLIYSLLNKMLYEYSDKKSGCYEILRCNLIEIIILTMRKSSPPVINTSNELCEYIIKYASKNITEKNILGKISKEVNFSTSYLSRKFKHEMNISFSEYLQNQRIEESLRLLANTNKKITEIAELCGYSDMKFFNFIFKKRVGITPRQFRQRLL